ncbi:DUF2188 domain-containing protein [Mycoplasmopsis agassizii]|uniref:DUF2188 domain-containing protein n=1 Tax=Mycoplasmopsis agassizii TaxID=33922 RepID=A0A1W1X1X7_9BACT|nr:DUF2188 domain-containing protein [Mycoplasmopsis agassizii]PAF55522.1 DUF2188 domain-containing protein [Mycoplasmopsis agassizii]PAK21580.1 DUF2188 domain-containing protein [Mycoplasmopsis agassizii]SMC17979.1 hypothetical protein SAMN02745179_00574 [Mycoplasmopsis agassizii]
MGTETKESNLTNTYYLVPTRDKDGKPNGWEIKRGNSQRASKKTATKEEALEAVKKMAANLGATVIIYKQDGSIQKTMSLKK